MKNILAKASIPTVAAVIGIWYTLDPWPKVGWITPNQHQAAYEVTQEAVKDFRDEWRCDEYEEELLDLRLAQAAGDTSEETKRKIEILLAKIDKLNCHRFDD